MKPNTGGFFDWFKKKPKDGGDSLPLDDDPNRVRTPYTGRVIDGKYVWDKDAPDFGTRPNDRWEMPNLDTPNNGAVSHVVPPKNQQQQHGKKDTVDPEMRAVIEAEIVDSSGTKVTFADVVGMETVKQALTEMVIYPTRHPELFKGLLRPPKGLLMFGPPGNGKTFVAKAAACESKATFFSISASTLMNKYIGESEKLVRALFVIARERAPSIIFIDEIDSILGRRKDDDNQAARAVKTEFLIQFDGVASDNDGVVVIGATNTPESLDDAVIRRLNRRIFVPSPNGKDRLVFLNQLLKGHPNSVSVYDISTRTEGYSASDLKALAREAAYQSVRELSADKLSKVKTSTDLRKLTTDDFIKALQTVKPSVTPERMKHYLVWAKQQDDNVTGAHRTGASKQQQQQQRQQESLLTAPKRKDAPSQNTKTQEPVHQTIEFSDVVRWNGMDKVPRYTVVKWGLKRGGGASRIWPQHPPAAEAVVGKMYIVDSPAWTPLPASEQSNLETNPADVDRFAWLLATRSGQRYWENKTKEAALSTTAAATATAVVAAPASTFTSESEKHADAPQPTTTTVVVVGDDATVSIETITKTLLVWNPPIRKNLKPAAKNKVNLATKAELKSIVMNEELNDNSRVMQIAKVIRANGRSGGTIFTGRLGVLWIQSMESEIPKERHPIIDALRDKWLDNESGWQSLNDTIESMISKLEEQQRQHEQTLLISKYSQPQPLAVRAPSINDVKYYRQLAVSQYASVALEMKAHPPAWELREEVIRLDHQLSNPEASGISGTLKTKRKQLDAYRSELNKLDRKTIDDLLDIVGDTSFSDKDMVVNMIRRGYQGGMSIGMMFSDHAIQLALETRRFTKSKSSVSAAGL